MFRAIRFFLVVTLIIFFWWIVEKLIYGYIWCRLIKGMKNPPRKHVIEEA